MVSSLIQRFAKILEVSDISLIEMGDISQEAPSMDVIRNANISGLKALKAALESIGA